MSDRFFDTNVLLYLLSAEVAKANRAEAELTGGGIISVQVLNEFAAVATRRLKMSIDEVRETLIVIRAVCTVVPLTGETHDLGLHIAKKNRVSIYDAMIVAVFDFKNGVFTNNTVGHTHFLTEHLSKLLAEILTTHWTQSHLVKLNREERRLLISEMLQFYQFQIDNFPEIQSFKILQEIF